jgi:hypothetical protein
MNQQDYILNITNPCEQSWDAMPKTDTGKYCFAVFWEGDFFIVIS